MNNKLFIFRIAADFAIIFLILLLPWWLALIAALFGLFFFNDYFEIIFFGFIFDSLYSQHSGAFKYIGTVLGGILVGLEIFLKSRMRI